MSIDEIKQYILDNKKNLIIGAVFGFVVRSFLR